MAPLAPALPRMHDLGGYLREQRQLAKLSVRQLSAVTGISNPYLSQIERGLKRPSADILKALAQGLRISAESLYVRAGLLDSQIDPAAEPTCRAGVDVRSALRCDPALTVEQRRTLLDLYDSYVPGGPSGPEPVPASGVDAGRDPAIPMGAPQPSGRPSPPRRPR